MKVNIVPEKREDRITKLSESLETLKQEFIGLDSIIDQIGEAISSWYITPEIISRPVVVSLWGMTGTGKSSVVRRLTELLGLGNTTMYFDCGSCADDNKDIPNMICSTLGVDDDDVSKYDRDFETFVFDEFQYARTIDEQGHEDLKPSLRPIWSIIDSGIVDLTDHYNYEFTRLCEFIEDLEPVAIEHPEIKVNGNKIPERGDVKIILESMGFLHYTDREIPGILSPDDDYPTCSGVVEEKEEEEKDPYRPLELLDKRCLRAIVKRINEVELGEGQKTAQKIFTTDWSLGELYELLAEIRNSVARPKKLDCHKALVFVIGNLDEAFRVEDDMNPDMSADMFYDVTSRVSISDIKNALTERFRAEQIARLGNNLIKYPVLRKEHFEKIIEKEVGRICTEFKSLSGITLTVEKGMLDLLYSEGVYPTQGVRPVFTTINSILTPYLSKILVEAGPLDKEVTLGVTGTLTDGIYRTPEVSVIVTFKGEGKTKEYRQKLQLGELRNPEARRKRYICSVHEAGHAVAYAWRIGKAPDNIISVSTDRGGFCSVYDSEKEGEIDSRRDQDNSVAISMAGHLAEKVIYGDRPEMCLLGASSDIESLWRDVAKGAYFTGYFKPIAFTDPNLETGDVAGLGISDQSQQTVEYFDGTKWTGQKLSLQEAIRWRLDDIEAETLQVLRHEECLIKKIALELGERGSMTGERFMDFVREYGSSEVTPERMRATREKYSSDYYKQILLEGN